MEDIKEKIIEKSLAIDQARDVIAMYKLYLFSANENEKVIAELMIVQYEEALKQRINDKRKLEESFASLPPKPASPPVMKVKSPESLKSHLAFLTNCGFKELPLA